MTDDNSPENLRKFLESDDPAMVRMGLSMAKGAGVPDELLPTILRLYMWNDDKTIRAAAKSVFTKYAPAELQAKVKKNWKASYRTLSITGDKFPEAIRPFLEAFKSQDDFAEIVWRRAEPLIKALQKGNWQAASGLGKIGEPAVELLIGFLSDENGNYIAARALGQIGDVRAVEPLIRLLEVEDSSIRSVAARALGSIGDMRAVEPLIRLLKDEEASVRGAAVRALGEIGDERAVEPLIGMLSDRQGISMGAVDAMGEIGGVRVVDLLIEMLSDTAMWPRWHAARALGKIGDTRAVEPLIRLLGDDYAQKWGSPHHTPRCAAAGALVQIGDKRAVELLIVVLKPLIEALRTGYISTERQFAAETLGEIGDTRAVDPLIKALEDNDEDVRKAAKEALHKLGHEVE
jgi:HEAT repeat protein